MFGTRLEAIKLCQAVLHMKQRYPGWRMKVCVTAQHRQLLDQLPEVFGVVPDYDPDAMTRGQTLFQSTSRILAAFEPVMEDAQPDLVLVQGDTTSTLCGAMAGFTGGCR